MRLRSFSVPTGFSVLLGVLAGATLVTQVLSAGTKTTTLETALFSVLQFVFSLGFAWILTRMAARREFIESQKAFAIAAYRRINEIDEGVERILARTKSQKRAASAESQHDLEVLAAIALGVRASIKSSIADWGDIIGDEITTIHRIEQIKDAQRELADLPEESIPDQAGDETQQLKDALERNNAQIAKLLDTLPPSLRLLAESRKKQKDPVAQHVGRLSAEYKKTSSIRLLAFWEPPLERDVRTMSVGDHLRVHIGGTIGSRVLAVCAKDMDGQSVGIILNNGAGAYYVFRESLASYLNAAMFEVEIISIAQKDRGRRHYFEVRLLPDAFAQRDRFEKELAELRRKPRSANESLKLT